LLTASGRAFCFGADFTEFENSNQLPELLQVFQGLILKLYNCPKVTIAALNGFASGAGLDLALACDFRIASERAKLGEGYISMGLVSDGGGSFFLPRLVGTCRALQLLLTGEAVSAVDAKSMGMIHTVCPAEELEEQSLEWARTLSSKPQNALRQLKELVHLNADVDLKTALENEGKAQLRCFQDERHQAIVKEFLSKRTRPL
jgi:2-(1,2-epoxy-1,2-dihydrophenyl)acetyl-CoA isomerase